MALFMNHCAIECTSKAMAQALRKFTTQMEDIQDNQFECSHLERLYELCQEFVEQYEEYLEDKEDYIRNHSE